MGADFVVELNQKNVERRNTSIHHWVRGHRATPGGKKLAIDGPLQQTTRNAKTHCPLNHVQGLSDLVLIA
jgi:hypothetical protein